MSGGPVAATTPRRVLYLSGTRADFGLMRSTLQRLKDTPGLELGVAVTGSHLSDKHGHTVDEITDAGLQVVARLPVDLNSRSRSSMTDAVAQVLQGLAACLNAYRPDLLVLLGDRGEMLAGALAALHAGVPTLHIHGGERSGTVDEPVRHAISKLACMHVVATAQSRQRLLRMGEDEWRIHLCGAPGLDGLVELGGPAQQTASDFMASVGLGPGAGFVLAVFHPVVQQAEQAGVQTQALAQALVAVGLPVLWLDPNADAGALEVLDALEQVALPPGSRRLVHLPRERFCQAMRHARAMVGNSSSGIIEAASFGTPVINVGDRQRLRERNANVTDVAAQAEAIESALLQALDAPRPAAHNVYGDGHAGQRIAELVATLPLDAANRLRLTEKLNAY